MGQAVALAQVTATVQGGIPSAGDARMIEVNPVDKSVWITVQQSAVATRIDRFARTGNSYGNSPVRTHTFSGKYIRNIDFDLTGRLYALTGLTPSEVAVTVGTPNYSVSAVQAAVNFSLGGLDANFIDVDASKRIYVATLGGYVRIYAPTTNAATAYRLWKSFKVVECYGKPECVGGLTVQPGTQKVWINSGSQAKFLVYDTAPAAIRASIAWMRPANSITTQNSVPRRAFFMPSGKLVTEWDGPTTSWPTTVMTTLPTQTGLVSRPLGFNFDYTPRAMQTATGNEGEILRAPDGAPYRFVVWQVVQP
jgi:hypothetical protein